MMTTLSPPLPAVDSGSSADRPDWISLAEATRLTGRTVDQIKTLAAVGRVRVDAPIGCRVRYHRADLAAFATVAMAS